MRLQQVANALQLADGITFIVLCDFADFSQYAENVRVKAGGECHERAKLVLALFVTPVFMIALHSVLKAVHRTSTTYRPDYPATCNIGG